VSKQTHHPFPKIFLGRRPLFVDVLKIAQVFCVCSLSVMCIIGYNWGPVIQTLEINDRLGWEFMSPRYDRSRWS
jgi:hypothetical protein